MDKIQTLPDSELREWEQYFFTENVLRDLVNVLEYEKNIICLCTPAVADSFLTLKNKIVTCLDLDERFSYLPGYIKYNVLDPKELDITPDLIIVDPPFFKINLVDLYNCIEILTRKNKQTKIIFAFVIREEKSLLNIFKEYKLQYTKFKLEYRYVDATKWDNYGLYSNCEFSKIKFLKKNKNKK